MHHSALHCFSSTIITFPWTLCCILLRGRSLLIAHVWLSAEVLMFDSTVFFLQLCWSNEVTVSEISKHTFTLFVLSGRSPYQRTTWSASLSNRKHCGRSETSRETWRRRWSELLSQPGHLSRGWSSVERWSEKSHRWDAVSVSQRVNVLLLLYICFSKL